MTRQDTAMLAKATSIEMVYVWYDGWLIVKKERQVLMTSKSYIFVQQGALLCVKQISG